MGVRLVYEGKDITHDFTIKNTGRSELVIQAVKSGFGCTAVSFERLIPPGAVGKVAVKISTNGLSSQAKKVINVETNDPDYSRIKLYLAGEVRKFATLTPSKTILRRTVGEKISAGSLRWPGMYRTHLKYLISACCGELTSSTPLRK